MKIGNALATYILQNKLSTYARSWNVIREEKRDNAGYFNSVEFVRVVSDRLSISRQSAYVHLRKLNEFGFISKVGHNYRVVGHDLLHRKLELYSNYKSDFDNLNKKEFKSALLALHTIVRNKRQYYFELKNRRGNRNVNKTNLAFEGVDSSSHGYYACNLASEDLNIHHSTVMKYRDSDYFVVTRAADVALVSFSSERLHYIPLFARNKFQSKRIFCKKSGNLFVRVGSCYKVDIEIKGYRNKRTPLTETNIKCLMGIKSVC